MKPKAIIMSKGDNVATALENLPANRSVQVRNGSELTTHFVQEDIPFGHKFAVLRIEAGAKVLKYGQVIGAATQNIEAGAHVHVHNVESLRGRGDKQ